MLIIKGGLSNALVYDVSPHFIMMHNDLSIYGLLKDIRVRTDPPHPLVCRKRQQNGAVLRMRRKKHFPVSQEVWHGKDPSLLRGPERTPKLCSPSVNISEIFLSGTGRKVVFRCV
jgi:hypothetical protein